MTIQRLPYPVIQRFCRVLDFPLLDIWHFDRWVHYQHLSPAWRNANQVSHMVKIEGLNAFTML